MYRYISLALSFFFLANLTAAHAGPKLEVFCPDPIGDVTYDHHTKNWGGKALVIGQAAKIELTPSWQQRQIDPGVDTNIGDFKSIQEHSGQVECKYSNATLTGSLQGHGLHHCEHRGPDEGHIVRQRLQCE